MMQGRCKVDLPQVDLMNFRVEYVRPRSDHCLGREAAERATKSRQVDLSRLKGFHLRFVPKMTCGVNGNWSDDIWKSVPFRPKQPYVCAFLLRRKSKLNLFTLYQSDYEQRFKTKIDDIGWPKKYQSLFESWIYWSPERRYMSSGAENGVSRKHRPRKHRPQTADLENADLENADLEKPSGVYPSRLHRWIRYLNSEPTHSFQILKLVHSIQEYS